MKKIILISILSAISTHVCAQAWNPEKAAAYAKRWCNGRNLIDYRDYSDQGGDCANFVSQCLKDGGLNLSKGAPGMGLPNNGVDDRGCIPNASALVIHLANWQNTSIYVSEKGFKPPADHGVGDPIFFPSGPTGLESYHSMFCSAFDWKWWYCAHTTDECDTDWPNNLHAGRLIFFHIKSNINDHCINGKFEPELGEQGLDCGGEDCPLCAPPPCSPAHCCNGVKDGDETGTDCGGSCPPCPGKCSNCQLDPGEECIDCGGDDCKPCDDVPKVRIVGNTNQLRKEVAAFNKITAKGDVVVQSGKKISFITNNEGSIVLQPGFKAEKGCTFTTQRKDDLSDYGRACGTICKLDYVSQQTICYPDYLRIYQLINAVRVDYFIYDKASTERVYENKINVTSNSEIYRIWDCVVNGGCPAGTVWYIIEYYVYCCDGTYYKKRQDFSVNYFCYKSSSDDTEEPENPDSFSPPNPNDTTLPNENPPPNFSITPNPNAGTFQLETNFPLSDIDHLKITNTVGAVVYESQHLVSNEIQLQNTAPGLYFVVMVLKEGTVLTQKVMVQR